MSRLIGCHSSFACSSARSLRSVSQDAFESKFFNGKTGKNGKNKKKKKRFNSFDKHFNEKYRNKKRKRKVSEAKENTTHAKHVLEDQTNVERDFFQKRNEETFIEDMCNDSLFGSFMAMENCISENPLACPCCVFPYPPCQGLPNSKLCPCQRPCFALGTPCSIERTRICFDCLNNLTLAQMHSLHQPKCIKRGDDKESCITCKCLMKPCCGESQIRSYPNPAPFPLTKSETMHRKWDEFCIKRL